MSKTFSAIFLLVLVAQPLVVHPRSLKSTHPESIQKHETPESVRKYLKEFGYLEDNNETSFSISNARERDLKAHDEDLKNSIKRFQQYYNLNVSGKLDSETAKLMSSPRCGVPDNVGLRLTSRFSFFKGKPQWPSSKRHLTYGFESGAEGAALELLRRVFKKAFREWSRASTFTFSEVRNRSSGTDIVIGFHTGEHGDGVPFEKRGRVLGHAFAPPDGRLHVDADQPWSEEVPIKRGEYDLVWVGMHEIGHLLGLGHSSHPDAVMYAYARVGVNRRKLSMDDVASIRTLYSLSSPELHTEDSRGVRLSSSSMLLWFCFNIFYLTFL